MAEARWICSLADIQEKSDNKQGSLDLRRSCRAFLFMKGFEYKIRPMFNFVYLTLNFIFDPLFGRVIRNRRSPRGLILANLHVDVERIETEEERLRLYCEALWLERWSNRNWAELIASLFIDGKS